MADTSNTPDKPVRLSLARETNGHIRALARTLHDEHEVGFLCECRCMAIAFATLAEYDAAGGAWLPGHKPEISNEPLPTSPLFPETEVAEALRGR